MDAVNEIAEKNQFLEKFMNTLNVEIQKKMTKIPTNLPPIESSLAILDNLKSNIDESSQEYLEW